MAQRVPWVLFGCGGHGRSVAELILTDQPDAEIVFVDDHAQAGETVMGFPAVCTLELPIPCRILVTLGDNRLRKARFETLPRERCLPMVSSRAHVGRQVRLGMGTSVGIGAYVGPQAVIGENTILNTGCIVEHEVQMGSHGHVAPRALVCGRARIGDLVMIGAGATVIDRVVITDRVIVGASATVVHDVTEPGVYVGTPARRIGPFPG